MIFSTRRAPETFTPQMRVASLLLWSPAGLLLLKRAGKKPYPGRYGVPAGKADAGEPIQTTLFREVREETGLDLTTDEARLVRKEDLGVRTAEMDFLYYSWELRMEIPPPIILSPTEHTAAEWHNWRTLAPSQFVPDMWEVLCRFYPKHP